MALIRPASLRDRLVALILVAALPILGLVLYAYVGQRREGVQEGRASALRVAQSLGRAHDQRLGETRRLLVTLAALPEARTPDSPTCAARFATFLRDFPDLVMLGIVVADGEVLCST